MQYVEQGEKSHPCNELMCMRPIGSSQLQIYLRVTEKKQTYYTAYGTSGKVAQSKRRWVGPFFRMGEKRNDHKNWWEKLLKSCQ
jgi:hypothetical protein